MQCAHHREVLPDGDEVVAGYAEAEVIDFEINDTGIFLGTCSHGHTVAQALQNLKYEVLFQSGAIAYLCGFHREAVTSFAVALERFFEFCIEVFVEDLGVAASAFAAMWKEQLKLSERQLGAFSVLYLVCQKKAFPFKATKFQDLQTFRNDVTHAGRIPPRDETRNYAKKIYEIITTTTRELQRDHSNAFERVTVRTVSNRTKAAQDAAGGPVKVNGLYMHAGGMMIATLVSPWGERESPIEDFEAALKSLGEIALWFVAGGPRPTIRRA